MGLTGRISSLGGRLRTALAGLKRCCCVTCPEGCVPCASCCFSTTSKLLVTIETIDRLCYCSRWTFALSLTPVSPEDWVANGVAEWEGEVEEIGTAGSGSPCGWTDPSGGGSSIFSPQSASVRYNCTTGGWSFETTYYGEYEGLRLNLGAGDCCGLEMSEFAAVTGEGYTEATGWFELSGWQARVSVEVIDNDDCGNDCECPGGCVQCGDCCFGIVSGDDERHANLNVVAEWLICVYRDAACTQLHRVESVRVATGGSHFPGLTVLQNDPLAAYWTADTWPAKSHQDYSPSTCSYTTPTGVTSNLGGYPEFRYLCSEQRWEMRFNPYDMFWWAGLDEWPEECKTLEPRCGEWIDLGGDCNGVSMGDFATIPGFGCLEDSDESWEYPDYELGEMVYGQGVWYTIQMRVSVEVVNNDDCMAV